MADGGSGGLQDDEFEVQRAKDEQTDDIQDALFCNIKGPLSNSAFHHGRNISVCHTELTKYANSFLIEVGEDTFNGIKIDTCANLASVIY